MPACLPPCFCPTNMSAYACASACVPPSSADAGGRSSSPLTVQCGSMTPAGRAPRTCSNFDRDQTWEGGPRLQLARQRQRQLRPNGTILGRRGVGCTVTRARASERPRHGGQRQFAAWWWCGDTAVFFLTCGRICSFASSVSTSGTSWPERLSGGALVAAVAMITVEAPGGGVFYGSSTLERLGPDSDVCVPRRCLRSQFRFLR